MQKGKEIRHERRAEDGRNTTRFEDQDREVTVSNTSNNWTETWSSQTGRDRMELSN